MHNFTQPQFDYYLDYLFETNPADWRQLPPTARTTLRRKMRESIERCYGLDPMDAYKAVSAYLTTVEAAKC